MGLTSSAGEMEIQASEMSSLSFLQEGFGPFS